MNEIQKILKDTERQPWEYNSSIEKLREHSIEQIELQIKRLQRRKELLLLGCDDRTIYDE